MIFPTEEKASNTYLSVLGNLSGIKPRIIIIKNTLKLDKMLVSEPIQEEIKDRENIFASDHFEELKFDNQRNIILKI